MAQPLVLRDEVYRVIGAAFAVYNELRHGMLEAVYQEALQLELADRRIPFVALAPLQIRYKQHVLEKRYIADLICFDSVLVELKAVTQLDTSHESQLINYLRITGLKVGLLINFGSPQDLQWKRFVL